MQIDLNALNLAVATKLSSMGQEWGFVHCNECDDMMCGDGAGDFPCVADNGYPRDFCTDPYAFGRLVEFIMSTRGTINGISMMERAWVTCEIKEINIKVALAQAFVAAKEG